MSHDTHKYDILTSQQVGQPDQTRSGGHTIFSSFKFPLADSSRTCIRVFFLLSHFVYNWQSWVLCPFPHLPPHFLARRHHIMEILCNCNFEQGLRFSGGNWRKNFSENNLDICEGIIFYQHRKRYFGLFFSIYLKKNWIKSLYYCEQRWWTAGFKRSLRSKCPSVHDQGRKILFPSSLKHPPAHSKFESQTALFKQCCEAQLFGKWNEIFWSPIVISHSQPESHKSQNHKCSDQHNFWNRLHHQTFFDNWYGNEKSTCWTR